MGRGAVPLGPPAFKKVPGLRGRARGIVYDKISSDFLNQKIKHIVKKDSHSEDRLHGESYDCNIEYLKTNSQK